MYQKNDLTANDICAINNCINIIEDLILKKNYYNISSLNLVSLAKALHILKNYPKITSYGYISIAASIYYRDSCYCYQFIVAHDYLQLDQGGSGESSEIIYNSEGEYNEDIFEELDTWIRGFYRLLDEHGEGLEIVDDLELKIL